MEPRTSIITSIEEKEKKPQRLWELDALRGIAIVLMVIYHTVFNLDYFFNQSINSQSGFWYWEGRVSAVLFMVLVGVASAMIAKRYAGVVYFEKQMKRGLKLIFWGLAITLVTWFIVREQTIWFGILHFLGFGVLITLPFARKKWLNLILALLALFLGTWVSSMHWNNVFGVFFGAVPTNYQSLDYYPILPRIGWIFLGIFLGNLLYEKGVSLLKRPPRAVGSVLGWMGKKSLWIYLIHPPVIFGVLWLVFK